jgi:phosphopantothenoylcysteine decarboxylase/phosphopantothenate--cysteine ligase
MKVVLGVTGCIAVYKAAELLRQLQQNHLEVQVVMTRRAQEFVTPLTFAALSGRKVITEMFEHSGTASSNVESAIEHIAVAQSADLLLVAPATANTVAKFAHGVADNFLSTLYLAIKAPVVLAPAMNCEMWEHQAVRENIATLRARGVHVVEPDEGYLACGMVGQGRLAANEKILAAALETLGHTRELAGEIILITAGPTQEDIDPVRFISNRSSGKMGYALAEEALRRGARVILVSGPTALEAPKGVEFVPVRTAADMSVAVKKWFSESSIVVKAAAVADVRPVRPASSKIEKEKLAKAIEVEPTEDILASLGRIKNGKLLVGFAAETTRSTARALAKLKAKHLDLLVVNNVNEPGAGFDVDTNHVRLLWPDGSVKEILLTSKKEVARGIFTAIVALHKR